MTEFDPNPDGNALEAARKQWKEETDTFGRVYYTILGVTEYTHHSKIAEVADCSPSTARKHLNRLVDMGLVNRNPDLHSAYYQRNDAYFEWRDASRIADELTPDEIAERVAHLESRKTEYENRFDDDDPTAVAAFGQSDHENTHERLDALAEWRSLDRDIQLYELAFRIAANDGHLIDT